MTKKSFMVAAFILLTSTSAVNAATIIYNITGTITSIDTSGNTPPSSSAITSISVGDVWSATLSIDSNTPNTTSFTGNNNFSEYSGLSGSYTIGSSVSYTTNDYMEYVVNSNVVPVKNMVQVLNDVNVSEDFLQFFTGSGAGSANPFKIDGFSLDTTAIFLSGNDTLFNDVALLNSTSVSLNDFSTLQFLLNLSSDTESRFDIWGDITSYSATVVPVPAAVWLFGSGLLGLVGISRRKKV